MLSELHLSGNDMRMLLFSQGGFTCECEHLSPTCKTTFSVSSLQVKERAVLVVPVVRLINCLSMIMSLLCC